MEEPYDVWRQQLQVARAEQGVSYQALAELVGDADDDAVRRALIGETQHSDILEARLRRIAGALGVRFAADRVAAAIPPYGHRVEALVARIMALPPRDRAIVLSFFGV